MDLKTCEMLLCTNMMLHLELNRCYLSIALHILFILTSFEASQIFYYSFRKLIRARFKIQKRGGIHRFKKLRGSLRILPRTFVFSGNAEYTGPYWYTNKGFLID